MFKDVLRFIFLALTAQPFLWKPLIVTIRPICSDQLLPVLREAWLVQFWMRKFGHPALKRTMVLSNLNWVGRFDRGPLTRAERESALPTCEHYVDKSGRRRYHGGEALKKSELLNLKKHMFAKWVGLEA